MTTAEVMAALAVRYAPPAFALFEDVRKGTGGLAYDGAADAMALSLWPSRGIELHGFEVKVSRSDWLRELKNPAKADDFVAMCHRWWLVIGDEKIIQPGELPSGWGLLVPRGKDLVCRVEAVRRETPPVGLAFVVALCRRLHRSTTPNHQIAPKLKAEFARGVEDGKFQAEDATRQLAALTERVRAFEQTSGVSIKESWERPEKIGYAVRQVMQHGPEEVRTRLEYFRKELAGMVERIDAQLMDDEQGRGAARRPPAPPTGPHGR